VTDDFTRVVKAALSDVERTAPEPPSFASIRAGGPVQLTAKPRTAFRPAVALLAAAALTVVAVGSASLFGAFGGEDEGGPSGTDPTSAEELTIFGYWLVDSVTYEGETVVADRSLFEEMGAPVPHVEITEDRISGTTGCNDFGNTREWTYDGGFLEPGGITMTAVRCESDTIEPGLVAVLGSDEIEVILGDTTMEWHNPSGASVRFTRSEGPDPRNPLDDAAPTTTTSPALPTTCSATDLEYDEIPESHEGLPETVAETRAFLLASALSCDWTALLDFVRSQIDGEWNDAVFLGAPLDERELATHDDTSGVFATFVRVLATVPYQAHEVYIYDWDAQADTVLVVFFWPPYADLVEGQSLRDAWDESTLEAVAALLGETVDDLVNSSDTHGSYRGFRVGISADGRLFWEGDGD